MCVGHVPQLDPPAPSSEHCVDGSQPPLFSAQLLIGLHPDLPLPL